MEELVDPRERAADLAPVEQVALDALDLEPCEVVQPRPLPNRHADIVAALQQGTGDMRADEPGSARNEGDAHRAILPRVRKRAEALAVYGCADYVRQLPQRSTSDSQGDSRQCRVR